MKFMKERGTTAQYEATLTKAAGDMVSSVQAASLQWRMSSDVAALATGNTKPAIINRVCARVPSWNMVAGH
jgi:hypothetical protein